MTLNEMLELIPGVKIILTPVEYGRGELIFVIEYLHDSKQHLLPGVLVLLVDQFREKTGGRAGFKHPAPPVLFNEICYVALEIDGVPTRLVATYDNQNQQTIISLSTYRG